jgi:uncharacterized protein YkwD
MTSRLRRTCALQLALACLLVLVSTAQQNPTNSERALMDAVNIERKATGLPSLKWDEALALAARTHAEQMARQDSVEHTLAGEPSLAARATRAGARFSWLSENIVAAGSVREAHAQFMKSPAHRANILDTGMDRVGIGIADRGGQVFVVEDFSKGK